ncbi:hypothetical protein EJ110_NYTH60248 [Nymphaea thermarum]|nr:hypothetical protein EJ110_NYTH60248 [Nymphaea thermarum]
MTDSSSSSTVHTNVPDVGSTRMDNVPVQVTTIQLNKENYLRWSAAITVGIAGRGRIVYVNGRKVEPVEGSIAWDTWYLEDNQVKMWIINSVSSEIQPLILRKKTARDMWVILEHMYGQKKRKVHVYQLMRDVYSLRQGTRSIVEFYAALKSKWEDLDYHSDLTWKCPQDQMQYMTKEWENRVFLFLSGLNNDYENIRSQILNSDESFSIEDVYARVEAEEQRKLFSCTFTLSSSLYKEELGQISKQSTPCRRRFIIAPDHRPLVACASPLPSPPDHRPLVARAPAAARRCSSAARATTSVACCRPSLHIYSPLVVVVFSCRATVAHRLPSSPADAIVRRCRLPPPIASCCSPGVFSASCRSSDVTLLRRLVVRLVCCRLIIACCLPPSAVACCLLSV